MSKGIPFPSSKMGQDRLSFYNIADGQVSLIFVEAKNTVAKAASIHNTSPVCTAALGRSLIATAIIGARTKSEDSLITVSVNGGGPIGKITCVSHNDRLKGYVSVPNLILPNRLDGKLDVAAAVGTEGRLSVIKDLNMKQPYIGQTQLVSGELAEDFAYYFAVSEQQPCLISLGVLVSGEHVLSAGGVFIAPMPGCSEEVLQALEIRSMLFSDISKELMHENVDSLVKKWFDGMNPQFLEERPISYSCACSKEKMLRAIVSLGKEELTKILEDEQEGIEIICHFCKSKYNFSDDQIKEILENI